MSSEKQEIIRHIYNGSTFFLSKITDKTKLPYITNPSLADISCTHALPGLSGLPIEILQHIYEYLLKNPKDLLRMAEVSQKCLIALMRAVKLSEDQNDSDEWFPFLQAIQEFRHDHQHSMMLKDYGLTRQEYIRELYKDSEVSGTDAQHSDDIVKTCSLIALPIADLSKSIDLLLERRQYQDEHNRVARNRKPYMITLAFILPMLKMLINKLTALSIEDVDFLDSIPGILSIGVAYFLWLSLAIGAEGIHMIHEDERQDRLQNRIRKLDNNNLFKEIRSAIKAGDTDPSERKVLLS